MPPVSSEVEETVECINSLVILRAARACVKVQRDTCGRFIGQLVASRIYLVRCQYGGGKGRLVVG